MEPEVVDWLVAWYGSQDPGGFLATLLLCDDRKKRLTMAAICRAADSWRLEFVEAAEAVADGHPLPELPHPERNGERWLMAGTKGSSYRLDESVAKFLTDGRPMLDVVRDILAPPAARKEGQAVVVTPEAASLARAIYLAGDFSQVPLSVLADALEEAGTTDELILRHLRGWTPHVVGGTHLGWRRGRCFRGCWALDFVKEFTDGNVA